MGVKNCCSSILKFVKWFFKTPAVWAWACGVWIVVMFLDKNWDALLGWVMALIGFTDLHSLHKKIKQSGCETRFLD
jgi:hypothetical protein